MSWSKRQKALAAERRLLRPTPEMRFWSRVDPCRTDGCMLWLGAQYGTGYGTFFLNGRSTSAQHFLVGGAKPPMHWDHLCRVPLCVNPEHLELVTHQENLRRGRWGALTTHCPKGHPYDQANTRITPKGHRRCRTCHREGVKAAYATALGRTPAWSPTVGARR